jgi:uncharacterized membrane protein YtjA (UPF0391 family)
MAPNEVLARVQFHAHKAGAVDEWRRGATRPRREDCTMLHYALVFLVIAIIAALFGFTGIAGTAAGIAKILFVVFLILAVIAFFRRTS